MVGKYMVKSNTGTDTTAIQLVISKKTVKIT